MAMKVLDFVDVMFKRERYDGLRPNTLHFAFYYADWHSVRILINIKPDIVFWADNKKNLPPNMGLSSFNYQDKERCILVRNLSDLDFNPFIDFREHPQQVIE